MIGRRRRTKGCARDQPGFHERLPLIRPGEETAQMFSHVAHRSRLMVPRALPPLSERGKKWCSATCPRAAVPAKFPLAGLDPIAMQQSAGRLEGVSAASPFAGSFGVKYALVTS